MLIITVKKCKSEININDLLRDIASILDCDYPRNYFVVDNNDYSIYVADFIDFTFTLHYDRKNNGVSFAFFGTKLEKNTKNFLERFMESLEKNGVVEEVNEDNLVVY